MSADREAARHNKSECWCGLNHRLETELAGQRLLNKRRLGSFYLDDVKVLLARIERLYADDALRVRDLQSASERVEMAEAELAAAHEREARWESIAAERGTRMDELQARAEDAETDAANARSSRDELLAEARERNEKLREALREIRDYEWHPGQPATDVREIARAALAEDDLSESQS